MPSLPLRSLLAPRLAAAAALLGLALMATPPAHAFWGLLGKAASGAGKAAGAGKAVGTVGKGAAAGAAVHEGASAVKAGAGVADEAAHVGARGAGAAELSSVNAALPPEVAAYLAKPAKELTPRDTAVLMGSYRDMVAQAGRTGDFTAVERLPSSAGTARTLDAPRGPAPTSPAATPTRSTAATTPSAGMLPLDALRVLAHAAHAGHRGAQSELDKVCRAGSEENRRFAPGTRASAEFVQACTERRTAAASR